jgi:hypothetical protein
MLMSRVTRTLAALAAVAALLALAPAAPADPTAAAAKTCRVGDYDSYGTTYVLKISTSGTSCRAARSLVRAFHGCRPGKSGRCGSVKGYSCSERREEGRASYDSRVTCRKGGKTVKHTYTQNT